MSRTKEAMIEAGEFEIEDDGFYTVYPELDPLPVLSENRLLVAPVEAKDGFSN